jgi:hypothetical protein
LQFAHTGQIAGKYNTASSPSEPIGIHLDDIAQGIQFKYLLQLDSPWQFFQ